MNFYVKLAIIASILPMIVVSDLCTFTSQQGTDGGDFFVSEAAVLPIMSFEGSHILGSDSKCRNSSRSNGMHFFVEAFSLIPTSTFNSHHANKRESTILNKSALNINNRISKDSVGKIVTATSSSASTSKLASSQIPNTNESPQSSSSLADMEDAVEQKLESNQPLNLSDMKNNNQIDNNYQSIELQHTMRAPTTSSSSSNTFSMQESSFENEDEEARQRQSFINSYLEKDDENWKRVRLEKILGKYKDVLFGDDDDDESGEGVGKKNGKVSGQLKMTKEEKWSQIINEEKIRIENGTFCFYRNN